MSISQISSLSSYGAGATYQFPRVALYQSAKTSLPSAPKAYTVELSHAAQVRSLKLQGFSATLIAMKTGLDLKTVNTYLGIIESAANVTTTPTYVPPKAAYSEPETITERRKQLRQDLDQLTMAKSTWSNMVSKQSSAGASAANQGAGTTLLTVKPAYDEFSLFRRPSSGLREIPDNMRGATNG